MSRDTQFQGFAKLLLDELAADGSIEIDRGWDTEDSKAYDDAQAIIARRVYDFACHVATQTVTVAHGDMSKISDMSGIWFSEVPDKAIEGKILHWIERSQEEAKSDCQLCAVDRMSVLLDDIEQLCKKEVEATKALRGKE